MSISEPFLAGKCSSAKHIACENTVWVTNKAMELMGSYGFAFEMEEHRDFTERSYSATISESSLYVLSSDGPYRYSGSRRIWR